MDVCKSICDGERKFFGEIKEVCKVSCVKIFLWSIVALKGTNIYYYFYIFEYGAEYGAESGAK